MKQTLLFCSILAATPLIAEETRELGAHEHGVGELNIAIEGNTIALELHAPGADIVGFEYEAKSAEDRSAIDSAVASLARPLNLFVFPAAAECSVTQASAELESEEEHAAHDDHDEHEEHKDRHAEAHDDHAHEEHEHEEHAEAAGHTEFHAEYQINCANPDAIDEITFAYFDAFENARELEVQIVTQAGAQAFEVERDEPRLDLRGMF